MSNVAIPKLLQLLADRPAGDLDVVGLSLALRPTQAEIVSAIAALVGDGRLDAETLRPPLAERGVAIEAATGSDLWRALTASATASATAFGARIDNVGFLDVAAVEAEAPPPTLSPEGNRGFKLGQGEPARPLFDALVAEGKRRGLSLRQISLAVWGNKARIHHLAVSPTVREATAEKVRAWIADKPAEAPAKREPEVILPPPPAPEPAITIVPAGRKARAYCQQPAACAAPARGSCRICQPGSFAAQRRGRAPSVAPNTPSSPPVTPTGADLAADLDALIERTGASPSRVSKMLFGSGKGLVQLRRAKSPKAETVAKVRLFIQQPPADLIAQVREHRRDPTEKPDTPLMDAAERQRVNGQRHQANIRRGQEHEAAERLDAGKPPRNSFERSTMANIERRREAEHRQTDPVEQAKLALQRKGRVVHSALIHGGRKDRFMVGGQRDPRTGRLKELTPAELIDLAEKVTGQTFRRVA